MHTIWDQLSTASFRANSTHNMAAIKSAVYKGVEELSEDDCLNIARRKMKTADLQVVSVTMVTASDTPIGFLGDHYKVVITTRLATNPGDTIDLHFFVKTKPRGATHMAMIEGLGAFQRECDFFSTLLVTLRQYDVSDSQDEAAVKTAWTPDCYFANSKLIVLDDLSCQGFRLVDNQRAGMDCNHCVVTFKTLARFHASSLVCEEKESQRLGTRFRLIDKYPEMFKEAIWAKKPGNAGQGICAAGVNAAFSLIKIMPQTRENPEMYGRVGKALEKLFDDGCELVKTSRAYRNVVSHGDLWANNILFGYASDETGGHPYDARLIDYQLIRYTPPAVDFICALHINTRRSMRETHFLDLARTYHSTLATELARSNLDIDVLVPWTEFLASLEHYRWLGVLICFVYYPTILMGDNVAKDVTDDPERFKKFMLEDQSDVALQCFEGDVVYRERMTELVEEMAAFLAKG